MAGTCCAAMPAHGLPMQSVRAFKMYLRWAWCLDILLALVEHFKHDRVVHAF